MCNVRINYFQNKGLLENNPVNWKLVNGANQHSTCLSDLGLQSYQLLRFVTNMNPSRVSACLGRSCDHHTCDDNGSILVQTKEGVVGQINITKVSLLHENDLTVEVDGSLGGIRWQLDKPGELVYQRVNMNRMVLTADSPPIIDHVRVQGHYQQHGYQEVSLEGKDNVPELRRRADEHVLSVLQRAGHGILQGGSASPVWLCLFSGSVVTRSRARWTGLMELCS